MRQLTINFDYDIPKLDYVIKSSNLHNIAPLKIQENVREDSYRLKFIDLFSGIGGFHYALHNQGGVCVFAAEWNKQCRETYQENFKEISPELFNNNHFASDVTLVDPNSIPEHDILCAGFPCQPFSISGKQQGFNDTRGTLFFNVLEIIQSKHPKVIFLENVKHLVHHDNGRTLKVIVQSLEKLDYQVAWKVLNAKDFGLAQNRERIIIVAHKNKRFDFNKLKHRPSVKIKDILDNYDDEYLSKSEYTLLDESLCKKQSSGLIFCGYRNKTIRTTGVRPNTEHLSRVHKQPNRIYHINGTHPTIPSQESSGRFFIYDNKGVRKLTIDECYKLQGFPKSFKKHSQLSACYNQIGNSVAIPMIEEIFIQIKSQLLNE
ncbi:DNA cytosine methyltransferase [Lonepinella sp. BR2474]|uniref:DNA cytosine methyltransferase n=1 Tax=Lonepinella sp. BR2474 TaxID=3434548 RepID=UPI003F6DBF13